jgi:hypothetical protein
VVAVLNEPGIFLVQLGFVRSFLWRALMSVYLGVMVQTLHKTKTKTTILVIVLAFLAVTYLVPTLSDNLALGRYLTIHYTCS